MVSKSLLQQLHFFVSSHRTSLNRCRNVDLSDANAFKWLWTRQFKSSASKSCIKCFHLWLEGAYLISFSIFLQALGFFSSCESRAEGVLMTWLKNPISAENYFFVPCPFSCENPGSNQVLFRLHL